MQKSSLESAKVSMKDTKLTTSPLSGASSSTNAKEGEKNASIATSPLIEILTLHDVNYFNPKGVVTFLQTNATKIPGMLWPKFLDDFSPEFLQEVVKEIVYVQEYDLGADFVRHSADLKSLFIEAICNDRTLLKEPSKQVGLAAMYASRCKCTTELNTLAPDWIALGAGVKVEFVNTEKQLPAMLQDILEAKMIGMDTESRPSWQKGAQNKVALLQLATQNRVYLVDLLVLQKKVDPVLMQVFANKDIRKIGLGLVGDFKELLVNYPSYDCYETVLNHVDINEMFRLLHPKTKLEQSLRNITLYCFQKQLSKSAQMSDWARRPLSKDQIAYAALDAHILLRIYATLMQQLMLVPTFAKQLKANNATMLSKNFITSDLINQQKKKKKERAADEASPIATVKKNAPTISPAVRNGAMHGKNAASASLPIDLTVGEDGSSAAAAAPSEGKRKQRLDAPPRPQGDAAWKRRKIQNEESAPKQQPTSSPVTARAKMSKSGFGAAMARAMAVVK